MIQHKIFTFFAFVSLSAMSCTEDPPPTLLYKDREIIDSLFKIQVDSLRPRFDSLCETRFDSAVQYKVDSIMQERQAEIQKYLDRIRQEIEQQPKN